MTVRDHGGQRGAQWVFLQRYGYVNDPDAWLLAWLLDPPPPPPPCDPPPEPVFQSLEPYDLHIRTWMHLRSSEWIAAIEKAREHEPFHTLVSRWRGHWWYPLFGDHDKAVVEALRDDYRRDYVSDLRIVSTLTALESDIDAAIAKLNGRES